MGASGSLQKYMNILLLWIEFEDDVIVDLGEFELLLHKLIRLLSLDGFMSLLL